MRRAAALLLAALVLHLLLVQPNHPDALTWAALLLFPHELPVILLLMLALPVAVSRWLRLALAIAIAAIFVLKIADFASFVAFNRRFNPVVDLNLVVSSWDLLSGTLGRGLAGVVVVLAVALIIAVGLAVWWATGVWARVRPGGGWRVAAGAGAVLMTVVAVADMGRLLGWWDMDRNLPGTAFTARVGYEKATSWRRTLADLRDFRAAAQTDPWIDSPPRST